MIYLLSDVIVQVILLFTRHLYSYGILPHQIQISLLTRKHRSSTNRFVDMFFIVYLYLCVVVHVCMCACVHACVCVYVCVWCVWCVWPWWHHWMFSAGIIVGLIFYIIKKSTAQDLKYVERFQSNMFFLVLLPPIIFESGYSLHKVLDHCLLLYYFTLAFVGRFLPEYWLHFSVCCNRYRNISINCWRSNIWSWKGIVNKESFLTSLFQLGPWM